MAQNSWDFEWVRDVPLSIAASAITAWVWVKVRLAKDKESIQNMEARINRIDERVAKLYDHLIQGRREK